MWHATGLTHGHLKQILKILKKIQKNHEWQLLFMVVNDLNGVKKKEPIEQNWRKLGPIWTQTKIRTYLTRLGPKRYFNL